MKSAFTFTTGDFFTFSLLHLLLCCPCCYPAAWTWKVMLLDIVYVFNSIASHLCINSFLNQSRLDFLMIISFQVPVLFIDKQKNKIKVYFLTTSLFPDTLYLMMILWLLLLIAVPSNTILPRNHGKGRGTRSGASLVSQIAKRSCMTSKQTSREAWECDLSALPRGEWLDELSAKDAFCYVQLALDDQNNFCSLFFFNQS